MSNRKFATLLLASTALASPLAFAAHGNTTRSSLLVQSAQASQASSLTRHQVDLATLMGRRNGTLQPAGEGVLPAFRLSPVSSVTRANVMRATIAARMSGELQPAGEAATPVIAQASGFSKTRAQVKQETRAARANGMLLPAGEAIDEPSQVADAGGVASATAARQAA